MISDAIAREIELWNADQEAFGTLTEADVAALRETCRIRPDVDAIRHRYDGSELSDDTGWRGIRVELIVFPIAPGASFPGHPWIFSRLPGMDTPCVVVCWRHYVPGEPGMLEVTWDWRRPVRKRIVRRIDLADETGTHKHAERLAALWVGTNPPRGRKKGDGSRWLTNTQALKDIDAKILHGRDNVDSVAMALGVDRSAIYRRVREATGMRWAKYVALVKSRDFTQH